jgi:hypothetical protein
VEQEGGGAGGGSGWLGGSGGCVSVIQSLDGAGRARRGGVISRAITRMTLSH